jgi:hypothetical protein
MPTRSTKNSPTETPPTESAGTEAGIAAAQDRPRDLPSLGLHATGGNGVTAATPADAGPMAGAAALTAEVVGAWQTGAHVDGLWTINQNRNCWFHVAALAWKKLSTASDTGVVALNDLAAHARQVNASVSYREESDGMVHELYVW